MRRFLHPQSWIPWLRPLIKAYMRLAGRWVRPDPTVVVCGAMNGLLYGDNGVSGKPIGDLGGLELFMAQAGMALENKLLQRRLSTVTT